MDLTLWGGLRPLLGQAGESSGVRAARDSGEKGRPPGCT